jgi:hypothetical protein
VTVTRTKVVGCAVVNCLLLIDAMLGAGSIVWHIFLEDSETGCFLQGTTRKQVPHTHDRARGGAPLCGAGALGGEGPGGLANLIFEFR